MEKSVSGVLVRLCECHTQIAEYAVIDRVSDFCLAGSNRVRTPLSKEAAARQENVYKKGCRLDT